MVVKFTLTIYFSNYMHMSLHCLPNREVCYSTATDSTRRVTLFLNSSFMIPTRCNYFGRSERM